MLIEKFRTYKVEGIFTHWSLFEWCRNDVVNFTQTFNKQDYVIICAGVNEAIRGSKIDSYIIIEIHRKMQHTNVIHIASPFWFGRRILSSFIQTTYKC